MQIGYAGSEDIWQQMDRDSKSGLRQVIRSQMLPCLKKKNPFLFLLKTRSELRCIPFHSRRTDNAVKNRFSTLCKKRAKNALRRENNGSWFNPNKKRVIIHSGSFVAGGPESSVPMKQIRYRNFFSHISSINIIITYFHVGDFTLHADILMDIFCLCKVGTRS